MANTEGQLPAVPSFRSVGRPTSVTVFGILNIVFGALGILCMPLSIFSLFVMEDPNNPILQVMHRSAVYAAWMKVGLALGLVATLVLLASGIGLLRLKPWARVASVGYGVYGIVVGVVSLILNAVYLVGPLLTQPAWKEDQPAVIGAAIGGTLGGCIGMVYPFVLLIFMTRPRVVSAFSPSPVLLEPGGGEVAPPARGVDQSSDLAATVIPYRNAYALVAYYLGVFSIFSCIPVLGVIGLCMAVAAFVCGILGLRRAAEKPEVKGKVHAWIGVICGGLFGLVGLALNLVICGGFLGVFGPR